MKSQPVESWEVTDPAGLTHRVMRDANGKLWGDWVLPKEIMPVYLRFGHVPEGYTITKLYAD